MHTPRVGAGGSMPGASLACASGEGVGAEGGPRGDPKCGDRGLAESSNGDQYAVGALPCASSRAVRIATRCTHKTTTPAG
jgi:hypothetical protein